MVWSRITLIKSWITGDHGAVAEEHPYSEEMKALTRYAYEQWERTCGTLPGALLGQQSEVMVLN